VDATPAEIARAYFDALAAHDLDSAVAVWRPGASDRIVGDRDLVAPDGLRQYFGGMFGAFPDFSLTVKDLTSEDDRVAVRWHATGTFAGPGELNGFAPNHGRIAIDGCDVCTVQNGLIVHNDAFTDSGDVARQLGLLPANGSPAQLRLAQVASFGILARRAIKASGPEPVGEGVWVISGGVPRTMNVYLVEDGDGVTVFDAGIDGMAPAILAAAASRGGVTGSCSATPTPTTAAPRPRSAPRCTAIPPSGRRPSRRPRCVTTSICRSSARTPGRSMTASFPSGTAARSRSQGPSPRATTSQASG
jgi:predicted ester cyclase